MTISRAPDSGYHERAMTHGTNIIETHREGVMSTREDARADQVGTSEGIGRRTVIGRSLGVALAGDVPCAVETPRQLGSRLRNHL